MRTHSEETIPGDRATDVAENLSPTVFLIDDDASFVTATARLMRASGYQVRTFSSSTEFLKELKPEMAGCAVLDLRMPDANGLELQKILSRSDNPLPVIFLTGHGDIPATVLAMRQGAEDFLVKRAAKEQLLGAVERALARDARERAARKRRSELLALFEVLTPREKEVLSHVLRGKMNKQIAADLGVNERTVKLHRTSITTKLRVQSVAELSSLAHEAGFPIPSTSGPRTSAGLGVLESSAEPRNTGE